MELTREDLKIDPERECERIIQAIQSHMKNRLKRRGLVLGMSGGIDSSVCAALAVRALGSRRVLGLEMPERHSSPESLVLSSLVADHLGLETIVEDISEILKALGFYHRYEEAVRSVFPEYGPGWKSKMVNVQLSENKGFSLFSLIVRSPEGQMLKKRLNLKSYLGILAATNFKQRTRKMLEYYHADRLHYAVVGTPNRLEYDQGFFVKLGDGAADIKPIAHLYKTQVYQLGHFLGLPEEILSRSPTTDTYSLSQGQDEFYFSLPYTLMDVCLYGKNNGIDSDSVAECTGLSRDHVDRVFKDIDNKRSTTRYLHLGPLLAVEVPEVSA